MIRTRLLRGGAVAAALLGLSAACSSTTTPNNPIDSGSPGPGPSDSGGPGTQDSAGPPPSDGGGGSDAPSTCASPGAPTPGPTDTHCTQDDGAVTVQPTSLADCHPDASADGGNQGCPYGDTLYGHESDDDDCKYHVKWSSGPICEGAGGVTFTVIATHKTDGTPLTGANTVVETFTTSPPEAGCDDQSTHPGPNSGVQLTEGPPGTYTGNVQFDTAGQWTMRLHFHEECADLFPDSPHGHAAYHLTVP